MTQNRGKKAVLAAIVLSAALSIISAERDRPPVSGERPAKRARIAADFLPEAQQLIGAVERGNAENVTFVRQMLSRYGAEKWINLQGTYWVKPPERGEALQGCRGIQRGFAIGRQSLLHIAASGGNLEIARLLLENGANINAVTTHGETPLHRAAEGGHAEMVSLLLCHGANARARMIWGQPFSLAVSTALCLCETYGVAADLLNRFLCPESQINLNDDEDGPVYNLLDAFFSGELGCRTVEDGEPEKDAVDRQEWERVKMLARFLVSRGGYVSGKTLDDLLKDSELRRYFSGRISEVCGELFQIREARTQLVAQAFDSVPFRDAETKRAIADAVGLIAEMEGSYKATWEIPGVGASA